MKTTHNIMQSDTGERKKNGKRSIILYKHAHSSIIVQMAKLKRARRFLKQHPQNKEINNIYVNILLLLLFFPFAFCLGFISVDLQILHTNMFS